MTNIYTTQGTPEFMEKIKEKYANESMILMHGNGTALLLHETEGKTVFQTPHRYEVIAESGQLHPHGFFAMNNVSITDEGKPIFENRLKKNHEAMIGTPGFLAFRLLRPIGSDTYVVLTEWEDNKSFDLNKNSPAFAEAYATSRTDILAGPTVHLFTSAPYITVFTSLHNEE